MKKIITLVLAAVLVAPVFADDVSTLKSEIQMLKAVQGVVMHEVTDRGLAGQYVLEVLDSLEQLFADVLFLAVVRGRAHDG